MGESGYNLVYNYRGPPAPLSKDGKVIDTLEVAQARAAHLAAYAAAAARVAANDTKDKWTDYYDNVKADENNDDENYTIKYQLTNENQIENGYHGPLAPLDEDGQVIDTPEVASAKAAHLAAHAAQIPVLESNTWDNNGPRNYLYKVPAHISYTTYHSPTIYRGPPAPLAPDGKVIDTPEVAKARIDHLRVHAHATAIAAAAASEHHDHSETCYH
ncbi:hypothetical protein PV326_010686 [Microctonus aethiopoides]|nr:hypothetical protein PV326_010686 [Microctonus aethiopoides]